MSDISGIGISQNEDIVTIREGGGTVEPLSPSFAFEHVAAKLVPFDLTQQSKTDNTLAPVISTGGLVFPYNPTISEGVSIKYDVVDLTHTNESYYAFKATDNVRITLSECIWTCDTFDNALYALSALHFLRSYSFMDFGRFRSGRPPSPMWFSAYGNYAFYRVPVLMEKADWSFPSDIDYVGVPEFGSPEYQQRQIATTKRADGKYTWLPIKFTVSNISLIVQHSPKYWTNWSLDDYRSGRMIRRDNSFHATRNTARNTEIITPRQSRF